MIFLNIFYLVIIYLEKTLDFNRKIYLIILLGENQYAIFNLGHVYTGFSVTWLSV